MQKDHLVGGDGGGVRVDKTVQVEAFTIDVIEQQEKSMAKRTITGTLFVSLSEYADPERLKSEDHAVALRELSFTVFDISGKGYSKAGTATVTVELDDENELIENKAESLREEIKTVRAEAENAITRLTEKLNSLLAITNESGSQS